MFCETNQVFKDTLIVNGIPWGLWRQEENKGGLVDLDQKNAHGMKPTAEAMGRSGAPPGCWLLRAIRPDDLRHGGATDPKCLGQSRLCVCVFFFFGGGGGSNKQGVFF